MLERHERCLEVPSEIERVQALALDQPTAGVTSLCTAHKSKGLEFGVVTLADDFPSAETLPHPPKPAEGEDPEAFTYSRNRAPRLWAGDEFLGAVVLAEEELNLRYVAVTRAEAECLSTTWTAPMFSELEAYRQGFPRCLLLDSLESVIVKPAQQASVVKPAAVNGFGALPLVPELGRAAEVGSAPITLPECPTRSDTSGNAESCRAVNLDSTPPKGGFAWHLSALDPDRRQVVVLHYRHRYPALDWGWLLQALAELRLVGEPQSTVTRFLAGYRLESAQSLIERFCLDVGLWVVEAES